MANKLSPPVSQKMKNFIKTVIIGKIGAVGLAAGLCFGCSALDSARRSSSDAARQDAARTNSAAPEEVAATTSPCANRFYPVKNGLKHNYRNSIGGGDTAQTMEYTDGAAEFTEVTTLKGVNVRHVWTCTDEGLTAASYGSGAQMGSTKIEPKHVSGVTLPKESDLQIGKTWQTVYTATGTSELGAIDSRVTINNKIVALDDEVKTPAGTFKAVKIEMDIDSEMTFGGKKMPVPVIKSAAWFAPEVGMVKSTGGFGAMSNSMEYTGDK